MRDEKFKTLPFTGAKLVKLRFCGNGNDSEVTLEAAGGRRTVIPLNDARMDLSLTGPISIQTKGWGDTAVVWEIAPTQEQPVIIEQAAICFPGNEDEDWIESWRSYERTGTLDWAVALRLKLVGKA